MDEQLLHRLLKSAARGARGAVEPLFIETNETSRPNNGPPPPAPGPAIAGLPTTTDAPEGRPSAARGELRRVPLDRCHPHPCQPRQSAAYQTEAMAGLVASIRAHGQMSPAIVVPLDDNEYRIIAGHRRWNALRQLAAEEGRPRELLAYVTNLTEEEQLIYVLATNINQAELNFLSIAAVCQTILERGVTQQTLAAALGWHPSTLSRYMKIQSLPEITRDYIAAKGLGLSQTARIIEIWGERNVRPENIEPSMIDRPATSPRETQARSGAVTMMARVKRPRAAQLAKGSARVLVDMSRDFVGACARVAETIRHTLDEIAGEPPPPETLTEAIAPQLARFLTVLLADPSQARAALEKANKLLDATMIKPDNQ